METADVIFDVCRCYMHDQRNKLSPELYDEGLGYLRSRRIDLLAAWFNSRVHDLTRAQDARIVLQVSSFFKKNNVFTDDLCAKLQAIISFEEAEEQCKRTNDRLDTFALDPESFPEFRSQIERCQRYVARVLGEFPEFLEKLPELFRVTSGATATRSRKSALPFSKVSLKMVCTPGAYPYLNALSQFYGYGPLAKRLISKNRVEFVPKDWRTKRGIACEPDGNMPLQLAFDAHIKLRFRRKTNINLSDQSLNQEQARIGSLSGRIATVDLKTASDTTAYNAVALLFPMQWFNYLRAIRSQYFELYRGLRQEYHKFSSMGNGCTFGIETLIFAACCHAVGSKAFQVYGDDITIESEYVADLLALLRFVGFETNEDKTFNSGPYRESCGIHWFAGLDITPRYIRELDDRGAIRCHFVNICNEVAEPGGVLQEYLLSLIKEWKLPFVPYNEDSLSGVWVTTELAYKTKSIKCSTRGLYAWQPRVRMFVAKTGTKIVRTERALFLQYLQMQGEPRLLETRFRYDLQFLKSLARSWRKITNNESSRYSTYSHKYVRKWVHWKPVVFGASDSIISLSHLLLAKAGKSR